MKKKEQKVAARDRSMDADPEDRSRVFFFPKRNPPVSIRANSREEALEILEASNTKEHE